MPINRTRRDFMRDMGIGATALPFMLNLPSLGFANQTQRKQRLIIMFTPNGVVPTTFWPDEEGSNYTLKDSVAPLQDFRERMLFLRGVSDKVRGDGDNHMRGMGCLLTGVELYPGNIQGGSHTPAGWASGISIDQEIKSHLQSNPNTRTRFGSLEFGVMVPKRADTWTRMVYAGPNRPIAPIDNPYQMFAKMYGRVQDRDSLRSVLDDVRADLRTLSSAVSTEDRRLIEEHASFVQAIERDLREQQNTTTNHPVPELEPGVREDNDNMPRLTRMQIDLLVNSLVTDMTRIATLQITNSVGQARMRWLNINEGHHELSHSSDNDRPAQDKLTRINRWYAEQLAYLVRRLAETPEPGQSGSLLDNTLIIWTNELGKGNSHTLDNIPFVLIGGGLDFRMGRSLRYRNVPHNRLLMSLAHGFGHHMERFGNPNFCSGGPLTGLS